MPRSQIATVSNYEISPGTGNHQDFRLRANQGGRVAVSFENAGDIAAVVSAQVSVDGGTNFVATAAAANETTVTAVTVQPRCRSAVYDLLLRAGTETHLRLLAVSGTRVLVQVLHDDIFEIENKAGT